MTDQNLTAIVCVLDRSGSMSIIIHDAIGGINRIIEDQRQQQDGRALMTFVMFDHEYQIVYENVPPADVPLFTTATYVPRGITALLDAIGRTIDHVGAVYAGMPESERPGKVLFIIQTDGHENASLEYSHTRVAEMIEHQKTHYQWEFMFLSAGLDAATYSKSLHIPTSVAYTTDSSSVDKAFALSSTAIRQYRGSGAGGMSVQGCSVNVRSDDAELAKDDEAQSVIQTTT